MSWIVWLSNLYGGEPDQRNWCKKSVRGINFRHYNIALEGFSKTGNDLLRDRKSRSLVDDAYLASKLSISGNDPVAGICICRYAFIPYFDHYSKLPGDKSRIS